MHAVFVSGAMAVADGDLGRLRISMTTYIIDERIEASVPSFAFASVAIDDDDRIDVGCTSGREGVFDRGEPVELPPGFDPVCGFVDEPFDFTERGRYPCLCTPNAAGCLDVEMRALVEAYLHGYSDQLFRDVIARRPSELQAFARRFSGYADRDFMLSSRATPTASRPPPDETAR
jgi:hypothetical protein